MSIFTKIFGDPNEKVVKQLQPLVDSINAMEQSIQQLDDSQLRSQFLSLKETLAAGGALDDILPKAFALTREASRRAIGQRHFDVQLIAGIVLHRGQIAEMRTGEGKTLMATLPAALNALSGKGVHVVTVNDYLAKRDALWMGRVYSALGLTVGCIGHEIAYRCENGNLTVIRRREAYECDITYGTNNEFGFDYLRDNMVMRPEQQVQRDLNYAIVDEVDSILIDEARTPLIISAPMEESAEQYVQFARLVKKLTKEEDYTVDEKMRAVSITELGIHKMEQWLGVDNLYAHGVGMVHQLEQALRAHALFQLDRDYVVKDGQVIIVDEFTGRLMLGRRYSEGLHQAIEAKEGVHIKEESQTMATITFQNLFRLYAKLSGMTGTAVTEAEEFSKIYKLEVVVIPTHRPMIRGDRSDRVYKTELAKLEAVVREIREITGRGQPVLVGTVSIEKNERLSAMLSVAGIAHNMLNAKNHEREAGIIAEAGRKGAVTVATNMAGRGVDIILGGTPPEQGGSKEEIEKWQRDHEEIVGLGGLFVVGTERHESRRIDNQLRGRSGRQGDPGETQFYVSLEDDLMRIFASDRVAAVMNRLGLPDDVPIEHRMVSKSIETAQRKVEGHNFDIRKRLVEFDDVVNKHREGVYARRKAILLDQGKEPETNHDRLVAIIRSQVGQWVSAATAIEDIAAWSMDEIYKAIEGVMALPAETKISIDALSDNSNVGRMDAIGMRDAMTRYCEDVLMNALNHVEEDLARQASEQGLDGAEAVREIERMMLLRSLDQLWVEHLDAMDHLRSGIGLRGYGQRDPLVEYKREAYRMFNGMMAAYEHDVVSGLFRVGIAATQAKGVFERAGMRFSAPAKTAENTQGASTASASAPIINADKIGRNDLCPCGSGKKYKKCHGG